jgi:hypothetical protein
VNAIVKFAIAVAAVVLAGASAYGRVQPQMFCWAPDVEFPVACDEEEDDDGGELSSSMGWIAGRQLGQIVEQDRRR